MASSTVTLKGQVTLRRDLLQHLGVKPGERIEFDKLPGGELRVKAARPSGSIDTFTGRHAGKVSEPLTIEQMNEIAASGWSDTGSSGRPNDKNADFTHFRSVEGA